MSTLRGRSAARRIAIVALVVGAVTGSVLVQPAVADAAAELMRAPYLTDVTATSVTVNWATTSKTKGIVKYGSGTACASTAVQASTTGTKFTVTAAGTDYAEYQNSVALTGLSTGTGYCYRIYTGDSTPIDLLGTGSTPSFTTLTSENSSSPVTFAVFADWGDTTNSGVNDGLTLNANAVALMAQIQSAGTQFGITVGDVAYPGGTQSSYGDLVHTGKDVSAVFGPSYWAGPGQSQADCHTTDEHA
jgi:hypothetical protein